MHSGGNAVKASTEKCTCLEHEQESEWDKKELWVNELPMFSGDRTAVSNQENAALLVQTLRKYTVHTVHQTRQDIRNRKLLENPNTLKEQ